MHKKWIFIWFLLAPCLTVWAQPNKLKIFGRIVSGKDGLSAVHVKLKLNDVQVEKIITDKSGKFEFFLDFDQFYVLEISKDNYVTKFLEIDTYDAPEGQREFGYQYGGWQVELFKEYPDLNTEILKSAVAKIAFNEVINNFDFDVEYQRQIYPKLDQLNAQVEQLQKQEIQQLKQNEKLYADAIKIADKAFYSDNFDEAESKYQEALALKANDDYAKNQLEKTKLKQQQLAAQNQQFNATLAEGQTLIDAGRLEEAKVKFNQALLVKPNHQLATKKIAEIDKLINEKLLAQKQADEHAAQIETNYNNAYNAAIAQLETGNFQQAINQAKTALAIKPNNALAQKLLYEAENNLKAQQLAAQQQAADKKNNQIVSLLSNAETELENNNFTEARNLVNQAKNLGANTKVLEDKIILTETNYNKKLQTETEKNRAIAQAEQTAKTNLTEAVAQLQALKSKYPTDALIAVKFQEYNSKLVEQNEQNTEQLKQVKLDALIAEAEKLYNQRDLTAALNIFAQAELISKTDLRIVEGKKKVNLAIAQETEKQINFNRLVIRAESQFNNKNYQEAYNLFLEASKLNSTNNRVVEGLQRAKQKIEEQKLAQNQTDPKKEDVNKIDLKEDPSEYTTEFLNKIAKEYPPGVTEVVYTKGNMTITKRVVVVGGTGTVYRKVKHSWGGEYFFRNNDPITKFIWDKETNL